MSKAQAKTSRLTPELLELADGMERAGLIDEAALERIRLRHLGSDRAEIAPVTRDEVIAMREKAQMSQAVFARYLNLTVRDISQLERGEKHPAGAALALLDLIRRKGIEAIL